MRKLDHHVANGANDGDVADGHLRGESRMFREAAHQSRAPGASAPNSHLQAAHKAVFKKAQYKTTFTYTHARSVTSL